MSRTYEMMIQAEAEAAGFPSVAEYIRAREEAERLRHEWEEEMYFSEVGENDEIQEVS